MKLVMTPEGVDAYARNNLWMLYTALSYTPERVCFICLWNGKEGDGPGVQKICTIESQSTLVRYIYLIQMNFLNNKLSQV